MSRRLPRWSGAPAVTAAPLPARRGFATFIVLWTIALAAIVLVVLQSISHRTAAAGRNAEARVRAYWAARAGVEAQIAVLTFNTLEADETSAFTITSDLESESRGELYKASFRVEHTDQDGILKDGPLDAHSLLNINTLSPESLILIPDMDQDIAAAIIDWVDEDEDPEDNGAEEGQYSSLKSPYKPRNAPMRSLREVELVLGVGPEYVRGEDWNLNGLLDANENDGNLSLPPDNADGKLDAGWGRYLTAASDDSMGPGYSLSGELRLNLAEAQAGDLSRLLGVDTLQAETIVNQVANGGGLSDFLETGLSAMHANPGTGTPLTGQAPRATDLTPEQLGKLLDGTYLPDDSLGPRAGKVNINTVNAETLEYMAEVSTDVADAIITERDARSGGFVLLTDLLEIPGMTNQGLAELYPYIDVRSNVFVVVSRGRDAKSGLEIEIEATVDRSTIPVVIKDLVVR